MARALLYGLCKNRSIHRCRARRHSNPPYQSANEHLQYRKYTEHAPCKTVTALDVVYALKRQGKVTRSRADAPSTRPHCRQMFVRQHLWVPYTHFRRSYSHRISDIGTSARYSRPIELLLYTTMMTNPPDPCENPCRGLVHAHTR